MSLRAWHQRFGDHARARPDAIALSGAGAPLTYAELDARANRLQGGCASKASPDQVVGLCLDWAPDVLTAMLATLKAGGAYLPLDPALPAARRQAMLNLAAPPCCAHLGGLAIRIRGFPAAPVLCLDAEVDARSGQPDADAAGRFADQLCYVIFTSGSTGEPKGVMVNHGNVADLFAPFTADFALVPTTCGAGRTVSASVFPPGKLWGALTHGGRLVAVPRAARADPQALRERLRAEGVTAF